MRPVSPELLLSLSPALLRSLVAAFGPLPGVRPGASPEAIARAVFDGHASPALERRLASILRFGTDSGRRAVVEGANARRDKRTGAWLEVPAADVAAGLALESGADRRARRANDALLALADLRLERELAERPTYELLTSRPGAAVDLAAALRKPLARRVHDVWTRAHRDGSLDAAVFLRLPAAARLVVEGGALVTRVDAPIAVDVLHVHPGGGRVSLTLALPELLPRYATALGLSLRPSFTLRPFHTLTPEQLACIPLPEGVTSVAVVGLRWRRPDGSRQELRSLDALSSMRDRGLAASGYVDRVTVRIRVGGRTVDAFLQLPHRLEISDPSFELPMREVLAAIGLFTPGAMSDDARSLAPYSHGDWRWRAVVGDEAFERLVASGRLKRELAAHVATEEHRMHGTGYVVRDVAGGKGEKYALAEDRSLGARLVEAEDRIVWRLELGLLAASMRAELGAAEVARPGAIEIDGVLDLGVVTLASGKLRFVYAMASPPKGWLGAVVRACGLGMTPVILVPRAHGGDLEGALVVELDTEEQLGVKRAGWVLGRAAEALGVAHEVEAWRRCEEELVVEPATQRIWIAGVLVKLTEKAFRFVDYLARRAGHVTTTKELGAYVSTSGYPDVVARRTKGEVERQIREALEAAGAVTAVVARLICVEGKKGYRLGVGAKVV